MKKALVILVALLAVPAMAATISIDNSTPLTAVVTVTTDAANLVGVALDVDVDAGAVTAVSVDTANFNIFPDAAYSEELGDGYAYGEGTPVCAKTVAGEIALPQSSFALCFANLNGADVAGADGAVSVQVTITVSEECNITICENATRGGIVAVDGTALDAECVTEAIGPGGITCQDYNLTKKKAGATDNVVNASDLGNLINYVNANKTGSLFVVNSLNAAYDEDYNFTKMLGGTDNVINAADLGAMINFVNAYKTGTLFVVNCNTWVP